MLNICGGKNIIYSQCTFKHTHTLYCRQAWLYDTPSQLALEDSAALAYMAEVEYAAGPALQGPRALGQNKKNVCCLIAE